MTRVAGKSPANGAADSAEAAEKAARKVQAKTSGAKSGDTITWKGETFRVRETEMPGVAQLIIGQMAAGEIDEDAVDGMRKILKMGLRGPSGPQPRDPGFDAGNWDRGDYRKFMDHAAVTEASLEEIVEAMQAIVEAIAARPTGRRPGSSAGRPATTANSTETSSAAPAGDLKD
jgi:hypothetical protein